MKRLSHRPCPRPYAQGLSIGGCCGRQRPLCFLGPRQAHLAAREPKGRKDEPVGWLSYERYPIFKFTEHGAKSR